MFKHTVVEHSRDQDACFAWIEEIETSTWDQLATLGQFPLMDKAIGDALEKLITRTQASKSLEGVRQIKQAAHQRTSNCTYDMA